eukprot:CFRG6396T1
MGRLETFRKNFSLPSNDKIIQARKNDRRKVSESLGTGFKCGSIKVNITIDFHNDLEITVPRVRLHAGQQKLAGTLIGEIEAGTESKTWHERGEGNFGEFEFHLFEHMYPEEIDVDVVEAMSLNSMSQKIIGIFGGKDEPKEDPLIVKLPPAANIKSGQVVKEVFNCDKYGRVHVEAEYIITDPHAGGNDDVTALFSELLKNANEIDEIGSAATFREKYSEINDLQILLVPGLFTEYYPGYYSKNLIRLKEQLGINTRVSGIDTAAGVATNADTIKREIEEMIAATPGKKIVLYGHSKGGCDIALCLGKYPELQQHVYGVIAMQAPYNGSYMIDWVMSNKSDKAATKVVEAIFGGEKMAYQDLAYPVRKAMNEKYPFDGAKVPTVCMCTYGQFQIKMDNLDSINEISGLGSMKFCHDIIMKAVGTKSDGMVAPADGRVPGASLVYLQNMFHTEPAMQMPGTEYKNGALSEALLGCLLTKVRGGKK